MDYTLPQWMMALGDILYWTCQVALLYPLWVAWQRRDFWSRPLQILFWVSVALEINTALMNCLGALYYLNRPLFMVILNRGFSGWYLAHLQTNLEGLGHIAIFYYALNSSAIRRVLLGWCLVLIGISIVDTFYWHPPGLYKLDEYAVFTQSSTVVVLCVLYFEQMLQQLRTSRIERNPMFWVCLYCLIVSTGHLMMASFINDLIKDVYSQQAKNLQSIFGLVNSSAVLVGYGLMTVAYLQCGRESEMALR